MPAAGTGVYPGTEGGNAAAAHRENVGHAGDESHPGETGKDGGLATAPTGAPVPHGDAPVQQMITQPSIFSFGEGTEGEPQALVERPESIRLEEQLPAFMKVDEDDHKHRHHYRAALKRRLQLKNNFVAFVSEFVGTLLFLFFSFGIATEASNARTATQGNGAESSLSQNAPPDTSALLYSSLGFGFSLAVNAWIFYRVSGSLFNPAVTLALFLTGTLGWFQLIHLTIAQILGAIAAAALCDGLIPGPINARTTLSNGISVAQGFWLEFFLTAQLIFAIFMLAAEKHRGTFLAPVGIGLALFIGELFGTNYTGGSLNPARSFGPDVVLGKFDTYHWIYWIAPYAAAIFTSGFYTFLKYFQYESANVGQDSDAAKQVFRDAYGNVIGVLETMEAADFHFVTHDNAATSNGATLDNGQPQFNSAGRDKEGNLSPAGQVKKDRQDQQSVAAVNLGAGEVHNDVA